MDRAVTQICFWLQSYTLSWKYAPLITMELTNWVTFPNNSFVRVKVGRLDPGTSLDKWLTLNEGRIVWHRSFNQVSSKYLSYNLFSNCIEICILT